MPLNVPGVYIKEDASLSLSVPSGATAVPVFVGSFTAIPDSATRVDSWLSFTRLLGDAADEKSGGTSHLLGAVRGYFENGGGPCFIVSTTAEDLDGSLAAIDGEGTILVAPDLWSEGEEKAAAWARGLASHASAHEQMAILHTDRGQSAGEAIETVQGWGLGEEEAAFATVYFPWLQTSSDIGRALPPVGHVAGVWARTDRDRGVWKAPANAALSGVTTLDQEITDDVHRELNEVGINAIRSFPEQGQLVWGARTLAAASTDLRWRYIPVRRLFNAAHRDIRKALKFATFESNTQPTWEKVRAAVDGYLHALWRMGALQGAKPEEAYFVQIGLGVTMTQEDIDQGKLVLKVGMAAVRPAEFIILEFTQDVIAGT
ncbi:phage tail sheath family protein [Streptomyces noursei]|uniref:phage tail sheath family protein n=1 Tax=Streptomyces noursei TaxID=1971 RepID=UPI00381A25A9